MKDFSEVPNSLGTFPNVTAQDCSGPGETDGTAIIADTITDFWGWAQNLLNAVGFSPNGIAESSTASQIVSAIRWLEKASKIIPLTAGKSDQDLTSRLDDWVLYSGQSEYDAKVNTGSIMFPLDLPAGSIIDLTISVRVNPGVARTGTNRMEVAVKYVTDVGVYGTVGTGVYDDGTTNAQTITWQISDLQVLSDRLYYVSIIAGNDAATNMDTLHGVKQVFVAS